MDYQYVIRLEAVQDGGVAMIVDRCTPRSGRSDPR